MNKLLIEFIYKINWKNYDIYTPLKLIYLLRKKKLKVLLFYMNFHSI